MVAWMGKGWFPWRWGDDGEMIGIDAMFCRWGDAEMGRTGASRGGER